MHLTDEALSAYLDGELDPTEARLAAAHLRTCGDCAETARIYSAVDRRLTSTPALVCSSALAFVSAQLDGELGGEEADIAAAHLAGCRSCRSDVLNWSATDRMIAALPPARPSARVDAAIAALGRQPAGRRLRVAWPVPALAVAAALSMLIVINLSLGSPGRVGPNLALVAVQQSVLNPGTGLLYVLHPENGTVAVLDAETGAPRSIITVGGRPTALALNSTTNTIIVLDATAKTLTEIDGARNSVTGSTAVVIPGTPTSLQVDAKGNVVVSAVAAPAAQASSGASTGVVAVFNGDTKKLESVKQVDVAPQTFVLEPNGKRALLISAGATTLVDASTYLPLATKPGGVAAAFAATGDDFAILSTGTAGATVSFARRSDSILVGGMPRAIAALPDGGFAVLSDSDGRGRITLLLPDGTTNGSLEVAADGRDLAYDAVTRQFTVIGSKVSKVALPASLAVLPSPVQNPTSTSTPLPTVAATPTSSATPTPNGASPTPKPTIAAPVTEAPERATGPVPAGARLLWAGTYLVSGARVNASGTDGTRIWYVDDANRLNTFNMTTGQRYLLAPLPAGANVTRIVVSPNHVYLADSAGTLYVETIDTEQLSVISMPLLAGATAITASPDERIWLATDRAGLVAFDPRTLRLQTIPAGPGLSALASDALGRIWVAAGERQAIDVYDPLNGSLTETAFAHDGAVTALNVDRSGALTVGTDRGSVFVMRNGTAILAQAVGSKIIDLVVGPAGPWYVAEGGADIISGPVGAPGPVRHAPASASRPFFDGSGRAWQADRSVAGFYVTLPETP